MRQKFKITLDNKRARECSERGGTQRKRTEEMRIDAGPQPVIARERWREIVEKKKRTN